MTTGIAAPLTAEAFAPFGDVFAAPSTPGRVVADRSVLNLRERARPSLFLALPEPVPTGPIVARMMERHRFSSQSFVPMGPARFLVLVAPHAEGGGPDMARARAFLASPGQGITYAPDVWHHGLTVLGAPVAFAVFMWRDGSADDEEFVTIDPLRVIVPEAA
jgi:ureidoglycolate lyase